jgi:hypothetical protein
MTAAQQAARAAATPRAQVIVIAKQPVPGRVKTRLTPPFSARQAARLAAAALADTLAAAAQVPAVRHVLALEGTAEIGFRRVSTSSPSTAAAWMSGWPPRSGSRTPSCQSPWS